MEDKPFKNARQIYVEIARVVRDHAPISRAEIASQLNRSPTTIGRAVDELISENIICEIGQEKRDKIGRPSRPLILNAASFSVLTVDLSCPGIYAATTDLCGNIYHSATGTFHCGDTQQSIQELIDFIRNFQQESAGIPAVEALVIGAPSIVNAEQGVIEWAPMLNWRDVPLKKILEDEFKVAVLIENDVNLAALGEFWKGAGKKIKENMLFISVGSGVGAGIIINGELYSGATHAAGEAAYFITDVNVLRDNAGMLGNIENQIGHDGLVRMAHLVAQRYPSSSLAKNLSQKGHATQTREILALAESGDSAAQVVYNYVVDILTIVICNSAVLLDPEMVVLGGTNQWNWSGLIEAIESRLGTYLLRPVHIMPSELGDKALIMGGSYSALKLRPVFSK
jgi:glucokinase